MATDGDTKVNDNIMKAVGRSQDSVRVSLFYYWGYFGRKLRSACGYALVSVSQHGTCRNFDALWHCGVQTDALIPFQQHDVDGDPGRCSVQCGPAGGAAPPRPAALHRASPCFRHVSGQWSLGFWNYSGTFRESAKIQCRVIWAVRCIQGTVQIDTELHWILVSWLLAT